MVEEPTSRELKSQEEQLDNKKMHVAKSVLTV